MKHFAIAFAFVAAGGLTTYSSATVPAQAGPEYVGVFEAVVGGKRLPLERQSASMEMRGKMMGLGGMEMYSKFSGGRSPVRFHSGDKVSFVVRIASTDADPASYLFLSKMTSKKKERRAVYAGQGIYGGFKVDPSGAKLHLPVNYRRQGRFMYLEPLVTLEPGEYMLTATGTQNAFLFGVD